MDYYRAMTRPFASVGEIVGESWGRSSMSATPEKFSILHDRPVWPAFLIGFALVITLLWSGALVRLTYLLLSALL